MPGRSGAGGEVVRVLRLDGVFFEGVLEGLVKPQLSWNVQLLSSPRKRGSREPSYFP